MSIVFITVPGHAQENFANSLYEKTEGALKLVIIQKAPSKSLLERFARLIKRSGWGVFREVWYAFLIRMRSDMQKTLNYFRESIHKSKRLIKVKVIETESVNSKEVEEVLKELSPKILVVWGTAILKPHILKTSEKAVNLHFGLCPYYRGALANQYAVLCDDFEKIGATIHYINSKADSGEILSTILAGNNSHPSDLFRDLNDRAINKYLEVVRDLYSGREVESRPQDTTQSKNFLLKYWTPKTRYKLAKKMRDWERRT